jgi:anaerobic magnesium-protoporphyrin IX monomethyl ester cyclase
MVAESVLLIFPPDRWGHKDRFCQPLGVLTLGTELKMAGIETSVLDLSAEGWSKEKLRKYLIRGNFTHLGITITTPFRHLAYSILKLAKELNPNIITLAGGPHPTLVGERILAECDSVDIVISGEAEQRIIEIIKNYKPGFYQLGLVEDIDKSPIPDRSFVRHIKYNSISGLWIGDAASMRWSRGCLWGKCTFCSHDLSTQYRKHSAERIMEEISIIQNEFKYKTLVLADNCVSFRSKFVKNILRTKIKEGLDIPFFAITRADLIDEESVGLLTKANCIALEMGIEAASPRMLDLYNKSNQSADVWLVKLKEQFELLDKNNILSLGTIIIGGPSETLEEINLTTSFCKNSKLDFALAFPFIYMVGSRLWREAIEDGRISENQYFSYNDKRFDSTEFSSEEIFQIARTVEKQVNSPFTNLTRWGRIYRKMIKQRNWSFIFYNILGIPKIVLKAVLNPPYELRPEEIHS